MDRWPRWITTIVVAVVLLGCASPIPPSGDRSGLDITPAGTTASPPSQGLITPVATSSTEATASLGVTTSPAPTDTIAPEPMNISPARSGSITARLDLGGPGGYRRTISAVAGGGTIWVSQYQHVGAWLVRIDPVAGTVTRTSALPDQLAPAELALGDDGTLLAAGPVGLATGGVGTASGLVARIDLASGQVAARNQVPLQGEIAAGLGAVWVPGGSGLQRLNPASLKVTATFPVAGAPATRCGLSASETSNGSGTTVSTLRYLDPQTGAVTATVDLGVGGHLLGDDPIDGGPNCVAVVGPPAGSDPTMTGSTLVELAAEPTMMIAAQSPRFRGEVRFAAGVFWLIEDGAMTPVDPLTLAPLGATWLLPAEVSDLASWTLLGSGRTLWWVGPTEALRVGVPIPPQAAIGQIAAQPWSGPFVPAALSFSDPDHGVLVGATGYGAGAGVVATTSDGGRSWTKRLLQSPPLYGVAARGALVLASAGCRIDAPPGCRSALLRSTDGGLTWTATREAGLDGLQLVSGGTAWAIDNTDRNPSVVASSRDGGRTWRRRASPCPTGVPGFTATGISFPTASDGWLACEGGVAMGSSDKALFRSSDGGATWQAVFHIRLDASGGANDALIGGETVGIDFLADRTGWLWTGDGLFATGDGGTTWRLLGFADGAGGLYMNGMQMHSDTTGVVLVTDITTTPGRVTLQSTSDGGKTWTTIDAWPLNP
jgi:hypothetical protein